MLTVVQTLDIPSKVDFQDLGDLENQRLLSKTEASLIARVLVGAPKGRYSKKEIGEEITAYAQSHPELHIDWPVGKAATRGVLIETDGSIHAYYAVYKGKKHKKHIGEGAHGTVKVTQNISDGIWSVIKVLPKKEATLVFGEHQTLSDLRLSQSSLIERNEKYHFVMEYAKGINLFDFLRNRPQLTAIQVLDIALQSAVALNYFHTKGYLHRDIKPQNIIYDPVANKITVVDVGIAIKVNEQNKAKSPFAGSKHYIAPELQSCIMTGSVEVSSAIDVYSLGVLLSELCGLKKWGLTNSIHLP